MRNVAFPGIKNTAEAPLESELLTIVREALRDSFPVGWEVRVDPAPELWLDAWLTVTAPDGATARLVVEVQRRINPRDVPSLFDRFQRQHVADTLLVIAPFIGAQTRERLRVAGVNYADATGNLRLVLTKPAALIVLTGAVSDPWREQRPLYSLKGAAAGRVVRALCDFRPPYGTIELSERANVSAATVSRVVSLLDQEGLVEREGRGTVTVVAWAALLRRWTQDYALTTSNTVRSYLEPRGIDALLRKLATTATRYAVTGSLAAARIAPIAPPRLAMLYVDDIALAAQSLQLRPAESGANILLVRPYDAVVYERTAMQDGLTYAAPSQVVADLLTSPGRGPAEGEELLRWMEIHEAAWRH